MARRSDHTRAELKDLALEAARSIVREKGVSALSTRKLADRIGYTSGTIYQVFQNRDDLVEQMNTVDTDSIEPMAHPRDVALRLRDDQVTERDQREEFLEIAPASERGLYLVPRVIE